MQSGHVPEAQIFASNLRMAVTIHPSLPDSARVDFAAQRNSADRMCCRVVLLTNTVPPAEKSLDLALQDRFTDFRIFLSAPGEAKNISSGHWEGLNCTVLKSWTFQRISRHPIGFSTVLAWDIPWNTLTQLRRCRPDVMISVELGFRTLFASIYRALHPASRLIVWAPCSEHTELARGRVRNWIRRIVLRFTDAVIVNAAGGRRYIESMGVAPAQIFCAPRTVDLARFTSVPLKREPRSARRLLIVGQLIERKGVQPFLQALSRWGQLHPEREIEVWLLGDGPLRHDLEATPLRTGISVRFLGGMPNAEIPRVFEQAGILVFPTLADEWGWVVNEAMAAGLPVLGSSYSEAVEELVEIDVTGWKFRPDHAEEMDKAIDQAMRVSNEQLDLMRSAARERAASFTPEDVADRILSAVRFVSPAAPSECQPGSNG